VQIQKLLSLFFSIISFIILSPVDASINPRIVGGEASTENEWPYMSALMQKESGINVADQTFSAYYLQGVPTRKFSGELVDCEMAFEQCTGVSGKICLIKRGTTTFSEKIANCSAGGGIAAIIYNQEAGIFFGLAEASIPAVSVSSESGLELFNYLNQIVSFSYLNDVPTRSFCGGSYLGGRWVLTAAHCVENVSPSSIVLNIGAQNLETDQDNIINVSNIFIHSEYTEDSVFYDTALIKLSAEPEGIAPVLLADETMLSAAISNDLPVTSIGRGLKTPLAVDAEPVLEAHDPALYDVELSLVDNTACNQVMNDYLDSIGLIGIGNGALDDMLCAGNIEGNKGICKGDSGGPLVLKQDDKDYLVGISSWSYGCALANTYGVFARVPYFKNTINNFLDSTEPTGFVSTSPGLFQFSLDNYSVSENKSSVQLIINRSNGKFGSVTVMLVTAENSAIDGTDYIVVEDNVEFEQNELTKTIDIFINNNLKYEGDKTFTARLLIKSGNAEIGPVSTTTITIVEDEINPATSNLQFSTPNYTANEADGKINLTLLRTGDSSGSVSVEYSISDTTTDRDDYIIENNAISFSEGETSKTIEIELVNDNNAEETESFTLTLTNPVAIGIGEISSVNVKIEDDDGSTSSSRFASLSQLTLLLLLAIGLLIRGIRYISHTKSMLYSVSK